MTVHNKARKWLARADTTWSLPIDHAEVVKLLAEYDAVAAALVELVECQDTDVRRMRTIELHSYTKRVDAAWATGRALAGVIKPSGQLTNAEVAAVRKAARDIEFPE